MPILFASKTVIAAVLLVLNLELIRLDLDLNKIMELHVELLRNGDWNFISIDWGKLARGHNYPAAKRNVDLVGNATAKLVDFLIVSVEQLTDEEEQKACQGRKAGYFHLVGFSLGAHVVGSVGASVNTGPLPRITGLTSISILSSLLLLYCKLLFKKMLK